jgi:YHS domain-containing protein
MKKLLTVVMAVSWILTIAQQPKIFTTQNGAIQGYDPVAYFKEHKPVKGKKEFNVVWKEATWYFASQENLMTFQSSPDMYAPQYGGYCAYGASNGYKAETQPAAFTVFNNKLYLNYDPEVAVTWNKKREEFIKKADENWKKIENK